ncbi:MAG: hypothetical protein C4527_20745 [Candidatus Omnitrophota bacterium]|jgi:hypothetical protein|nr:MAG: hypothetical protein C4527_20745 [Candidatus Omnitrophota bacterium]
MIVVALASMAVLILGGILLCSWAMNTYKKRNQLLVDLGLVQNWMGEESNPFYKWGWRKATGERVWAERIVREAFAKAKIWMIPADLLFFEDQCKQFETRQKIDLEKLQNYVETMIHRTEAMNNTIQKLVSKIIHQTLSISVTEAENILREQGILVEKEKVRHRFGTWEMRRMAADIGKQILSAESAGFRMEDTTGHFLFTIKGYEGWQQFVKSYKEALDAQLSRGSLPNYQSTLRSLRASVREGLLKDFEDDIRESRNFRSAIEEEIHRKEIALTREQVDDIETVFYTWQFSNEVRFNLIDHRKARELLGGKKVCTHFREMIFTNLSPDFQSLKTFLDLFPRRVIFYGGDSYSRAFASDQYLRHVEELLLVFSTPVGEDPIPPALLSITREEIEHAREAGSINPALPLVLQKKRRQEFGAGERYISTSIEKKKQESLRDRYLNAVDGEEKGWIINLALDENSYPDEYAELEVKPYRSYVRFPCDEYGSIDYMSQSFHAKQQRTLFVNQILDTLTHMPPIGVKMSSPAAANSSANHANAKIPVPAAV